MEILAEQAKKVLDLDLTTAQLNTFQLYYTELINWNSHTNLTAITEYAEVQIKHFLDSLTLASPLWRGDSAKQTQAVSWSNLALIDIGAGAGLPGVALKILYPELRLTLVDSVGKKTAFLSQLVAKLNLPNVTVLTGRAEDLGQQPAHRERYDIATGRAVAALAVLAEYCLPLCKVGGIFIAPKKGDLSQELEQAKPAITKLGGQLRQTKPFELESGTSDKRLLVVADKIKASPTEYPRRAGVPAKRPLS
jgi:16S rRNA (guanine527-N7)-methyltransferase